MQKALRSAALTVFLVPARMDSAWSRSLREAGAHKPLGGSMVAIWAPGLRYMK